MFLKKPDEKDLKEITLDEFEIGLMNLIRKDVQPERLNPEGVNYFSCLECEYDSTQYIEIFRTLSKKEAENWVNQKSFCRTSHEKINICDSPNTENK